METRLYAAIIADPGLDLATYANRAGLGWVDAQAARDVLKHERKIKTRWNDKRQTLGWYPTR